MSSRWRDGDGVRAESIGHRFAAGQPLRRDEAGIGRKMSVYESFHLTARNSPAERIKNRKKAAHRSRDSERDGFFHCTFGRFTWRPLARSQKRRSRRGHASKSSNRQAKQSWRFSFESLCGMIKKSGQLKRDRFSGLRFPCAARRGHTPTNDWLSALKPQEFRQPLQW